MKRILTLCAAIGAFTLGGVLARAQNDPPKPTVTVTAIGADATAKESGLVAGRFTVTRQTTDKSAALNVTINLTGSTAINGTDYATISSTLVTIDVDQFSKVVTVTPLEDSLVEPDETVVMNIVDNGTYFVGTPASATVTIRDTSVVTITASDANASETGPNPGTYRVTRTGGDQTADLVVNFLTPGGTAGAGDYTLPLSATISANTTFADVTLMPIQDSASEGEETVILTVATSLNYTVGTPNNATVAIADASADFYTGYISAGNNHTVVLKFDGSVWAAGLNASGQLGDNSLTEHILLAGVNNLGSGSGVVTVRCGGSHSLALMSDGTVSAWGENGSGQIGNNSLTDQKVPLAVSGLNNVTAIAGGGGHSLALIADGTLKAWGENADGQIGINNTIDQKVPVVVTGVNSVTRIAAGGNHSLALLINGTVQAWGDNSNGQLGDNSLTDRRTAVPVQGLTSVADIKGGGLHSLALLSDGTVRAWGDNLNGQLGDGTTTDRLTPVPVTISAGVNLSGVKAIAAGANHSLALLNDGTVYAWGDNTKGQLGDGTSGTDRSRAVPVSGLTDVMAIAAGSLHSLALKADGSVWIWGYTNYGLASVAANYSMVPVRRENTVWLTAAPAIDTDRDGLPDAWETQFFGNLGRDGTGDYDGDGLTDRQEYQLGLDPTVDQSAQSGNRRNYTFDRLDRLDSVTGNGQVDLTLDKEDNITNVAP